MHFPCPKDYRSGIDPSFALDKPIMTGKNTAELFQCNSGMENLRKPGFLREPEELLRCPAFGATVGKLSIAKATRRGE
jgi:hypothetical protein